MLLIGQGNDRLIPTLPVRRLVRRGALGVWRRTCRLSGRVAVINKVPTALKVCVPLEYIFVQGRLFEDPTGIQQVGTLSNDSGAIHHVTSDHWSVVAHGVDTNVEY